MLILMKPFILLKKEVYIWICRKLSTNQYIATPPDALFLFATNPRICSKKKIRCLAVN